MYGGAAAAARQSKARITPYQVTEMLVIYGGCERRSYLY